MCDGAAYLQVFLRTLPLHGVRHVFAAAGDQYQEPISVACGIILRKRVSVL